MSPREGGSYSIVTTLAVPRENAVLRQLSLHNLQLFTEVTSVLLYYLGLV